MKHDDAVKFSRLTYMDVLERQLRVMDSTAISLAMDNDMPIVVFNMFTNGNLNRVVMGEDVGTTVEGRKVMEEILMDTEDRMEKALTSLDRDFSRLRTGRASTTLLDGIKVDYYGTMTPISQLASVSTPDSRTITIQPWDKSAFSLVRKGNYEIRSWADTGERR